MEFPENARTNNYHLGDFSQITWTALVVDDPSLTGNLGSQVSGEPFEGARQYGWGHILEEASNALRKDGYHSLFDETSLITWVFETTSQYVDDDDRKRRHRCLGELASSYGLIGKTAGTLEPSDTPVGLHPRKPLGKLPQTPQPSSAFLESNSQNFQANSLIDVEEPFSDQASDHSRSTHDHASIRLKFITSMSMSIVSSICSDGVWLRLGSNFCVGPLQGQFSGDKYREPIPVTRELSQLSITLRWSSIGKMLLTGNKSPARGLRQLSHYRELANLTLPLVETTVILAPSGFSAILIGAALNDHHEMRNLITARLRHQNISIDPRTEWLKLRIPIEDTCSFPKVILWPANLCFASSKRLQDSQDLAAGESEDMTQWVDPLERAEKWYLEGPARVKALEEAKRKAKERLAEIARETHGSDDEEASMFDGGISNGRLNLQDMSGVYPTPPDGAPVPFHAMAGTQEPSNQIEAEAITSTPANLEPGASLPMASPRLNETPSFQDDEGGDLFGEIDSEMFAANGLTEDDFNFFDEPSPVEEEPVQVQGPQDLSDQAVGSHNLTPHHTSSFQSPAVNSVNTSVLKVSDSKDASQDNSVTISDSSPCQAQETTVQAFDILPPVSEMDKLRDLEPRSLNVDNDHSQIIMEDPKGFQGNDDQQGSGSMNLDGKYGNSGYFGFDQVDTPEGVEPGRLSEREKLAMLDTKEYCDAISSLSESSSDQEMNEGEMHESVAASSSKVHASAAISLQAPLKRKRDASLGIDTPITPFASQQTAASPYQDNQDLLDVPMLNLFTTTSSAPLQGHLPSSDEHIFETKRPSTLEDKQIYLRNTQVLIDQIIHGDTHCSETPVDTIPAQDELESKDQFSQSNFLEAMMQRLHPQAKQCILKDILDSETQLSPTTSSETTSSLKAKKPFDPARPTTKKLDDREKPFSIKSPLACVRRMDSQMDISVSALQFWEELGLAPLSCEKDVTAFCIYPESIYLKERAISFLESVKGAYQCCKLGTHRLGLDLLSHREAFVPVPMGGGDSAASEQAIREVCETLGRKLAAASVDSTNFVIYMIGSSSSPSILPQLCRAFLGLVELYASILNSKNIENGSDLILQILPLAAIASRDVLVIPPPVAYRKIAFQIYSRCPPRKGSGRQSSYDCAPAVQLATTIPRTIDFSLSAAPTAGLSHAERCIHVGYCWYSHIPWLSASWTDNRGSRQWSACYRIASDRSENWPTVEEAIKDMWDTTMDLIDPAATPSRVFIAKCSPMGQREMDAWLSTSFQSPSPKVFLTLLAAVESPNLQFPSYTPAPADLINQDIATPGSTPAANFVSPEQSGYPLTPGVAPNLPTPTSASFDQDHDTRLVDVSEETWGLAIPSTSSDAVLGYSGDISPWCPALLSGQLMKRAGTRDEDGLITLGIDVLHMTKSSNTLLKEILTMYGGLATLARIRGIVNPVRSVLPWHLAAAKKSHDGLQAIES